MWKDFFYFSRGERKCIAILFAVVVLLVFLLMWYKHLYPEPSERIPDEHLAAFEDSLKNQRMLSASWKKEVSGTAGIPSVSEGELFRFDPNVADSATLCRLGLTPRVVRNVLKYRAKGGRFRTPESFARIYGLTEACYNRLYPYIEIKNREEEKKRLYRKVEPEKSKPDTLKKRNFAYVPKYSEGTVIDLNLADTASLKRIPGIGPVRAMQIVAYRKRLGGFYTTEQLAEVQGLPKGVERWFKVMEPPEKNILINRWGVERLRNHPYLNFYQAKIIVEHRHKYGSLNSVSALSLYEEFSKKDLERLEHYADFSDR